MGGRPSRGRSSEHPDVRQLELIDRYHLPFDAGVLGFNERWWVNRPVPMMRDRHDWFSFVVDGEEVARAEVDWATRLGGDYAGPPLPREVVQITFIEVRADRRGAGIGRWTITSLISRYPGSVLVAFSEQADDFWAGVGWERRRRADGDARYRPLFVWDRRAAPRV